MEAVPSRSGQPRPTILCNKPPACHAERSEESACCRTRILRCAQHDTLGRWTKVDRVLLYRKISIDLHIRVVLRCQKDQSIRGVTLLHKEGNGSAGPGRVRIYAEWQRS